MWNNPESLRMLSVVLVWLAWGGAFVAALAIPARYYVDQRLAAVRERAQAALEEGLREQIGSAETRSVQAEERSRRAAQVVAKADYRHLSPSLRQQLLERMGVMAKSETWKGLKVLITVEPSTPLGTRRFAEEIASVMSLAGFDVTRPNADNVYMEGASLPLWVCNAQQVPLVEEMAAALTMILHTAGKQQLAPVGEIGTLRIHLAGQPSFDEQGGITLR